MAAPNFQWDNGAGRFRGPRGKFVAGEKVRGALDGYLDEKQERALKLAGQLQRREISLADWQRQFGAELTKMHLNAAALARGGAAQMDDAALEKAGAFIRSELKYLERMAIQTQLGKPLDGRFLQRVKQFSQAPRTLFHEAEREEKEKRGFDEERSVRHARDSCAGCLFWASVNWRPLGTVALPGTRDCRRNCRCMMEYRETLVNRATARTAVSLPINGRSTPARPFTGPFMTVPEAEDYARRLGVKDVDYGGQLNIANASSQVLEETARRTGIVPDAIKVRSGSEFEDPTMGIAQHRFDPKLKTSTIEVNRDALYWQDQTGASAQAQAQALHGVGYFSTPHVLHPLRQEIGHSLHALKNPKTFVRVQGRKISKKAEKEIVDAGDLLSDYATKDIPEFVSEVYCLLIDGTSVSPVVLKWYSHYGGVIP